MARTIQTARKNTGGKAPRKQLAMFGGPAKKIRPRVLAEVVGFIDEGGRTSCATTETEHYRLRTVGLMGASVLTKDLEPAIESMLSTLQSRQPEHGLGGNVRRDGQILMAKAIRNAGKKHERVNTELSRVISKSSSILHPELCADVCRKLPPELQEIVYRYLTTMNQRICVNVSKDGDSTAGTTTVAYMNRLGVAVHSRPWFCDATMVGDGFSERMLRMFYATSRFRISDPGHLQLFLNKRLWGTIAPKHALRRIEIDVPLFNYEHPAVLDRIKYDLAFLKDLIHSKATIIIHLSLSDIMVPDMTLASAQEDAHREFVRTGREMSNEWWVTVHESIRMAHRRTMEDAT